jgi:hypothetical protein
MPFRAPWRAKVTLGDFVFGLSEYRLTFLLAQRPSWTLYNNRNLIDSYTTDPAKLLRAMGSQGHERNGEFLRFLQRDAKYNVAIGVDTNFRNQTALARDQRQDVNHRLRAKCKGALKWIAERTYNTAHFLIDGLDQESVVTKRSMTGPIADYPLGPAGPSFPQRAKHRTYAGSELRWIFRNRHREAVRQHIQFWFGGQPIPPPWDHPRWHDIWTRYRPTHGAPLSPRERPYLPGWLEKFFRDAQYDTQAPPDRALEPTSDEDYFTRIGYNTPPGR